MALDEAVAAASPLVPTVRVYRWDPWTLSLGYFQRVEERDIEPFLSAGFAVTRRSTGGGAIFHADEVTYSVVLPADDPRIPRPAAASYDWLHGAVQEALATLGIPTDVRGEAAKGPDPFFCFSRTAAIDLVAGGRKIVGSAQRRTRTAFLQHGSIPLSPNGTAPESTSGSEERAGRSVDPEELEEALGRAFARVLGAEAVPGRPTEAEESAARALEAEKYGNREWVLRTEGRPCSFPPPAGPPPPLRVLRAAVSEGNLRVLASVGGDHPVLPHGGLRAADVAVLRRVEERASPGERDPWDSTFRRSLLGGGEGAPPVAFAEEREDAVLLLLYGTPPSLLHLDLKRLNYADLGPRRTGDWAEDARNLLGDLLSAAPGAARGPGACALLRGGPPPFLPGPEALIRRVALLGR
jgi:lipoate-protein ligase A